MSKPRLLMVDEDEHVARALTYVLEREGFEVHISAGGTIAIEAVVELKPDAILLEVKAAPHDGLELLQWVRADESLRNTAVILLTAQSRPKDIVAGLERGADDYITKPYDPKEVLARLNAQLRMRRLQAQLVESERWRVLLETAGAVAHEMSQPLTAVMGNLELLLQRLPAAGREHATASRVFENCERAVALLRKLQRIEAYVLKDYPGTTGILDIERSSRY